jgi:hypothetical protein
LACGGFARFAPPFLAEGDGAVADFIPRQRHGRRVTGRAEAKREKRMRLKRSLRQVPACAPAQCALVPPGSPPLLRARAVSQGFHLQSPPDHLHSTPQRL